MKFNLGYFWAKLLKYCNRPALRDCQIDRTSKIGSGSNCVDVLMGRYSYMGMNNAVTNTSIGSFCSIASYCSIGGGNHSMTTVSTSPVFYGGRNILHKNFIANSSPTSKRVIIGNDVWIGQGVFIKDGITIGDGAIIGAHSVVTHDVAPYAVVAGSPAKLIRYRFTEKQIEALLYSKWWNMTEEQLIENAEAFSSVDRLIKQLEAKE